MPLSLPKLVLIEFLGTLILALVVGTLILNLNTGGYSTLYLPMAIGATLALLVYSFQASGTCSFNPAVSFGLFVVKKISVPVFLFSVLAEVLGAYLGVVIAHFLTGAPLLAPQGDSLRASIGELIGSFIFVFAVTRVALGQVPSSVGGAIVGVALLVGLTIAQAVSGGILNPALALGLGSTRIAYILMPFIGALLASMLARILQPSLPKPS